MVGYDTYGHFLPQNQRSFLRNSNTWLRAKPREGVLGAFLLYGDRSRKNWQERESRGLPSCNFGAKPSDFLDFIQPGQMLSKNTRSSPCRQARCSSSAPLCPICLAWLAAAGQWGALRGVKTPVGWVGGHPNQLTSPKQCFWFDVIVQPLDRSKSCIYPPK